MWQPGWEGSLGENESESWSHSRVQLFAIPRTVASLAPLSMEFSRQEYWSGLPLGENVYMYMYG